MRDIYSGEVYVAEKGFKFRLVTIIDMNGNIDANGVDSSCDTASDPFCTPKPHYQCVPDDEDMVDVSITETLEGTVSYGWDEAVFRPWSEIRADNEAVLAGIPWYTGS